MFATAAQIASPITSSWQSPLMKGEVHTHQLMGEVNAIAHNDHWLAIATGHTLNLYRLKNFSWQHSHRQINLGIIPKHLLLGGMDSRYLIAINQNCHYEVWDRVSATRQVTGHFMNHPSNTQYQIINQQYLLVAAGSDLSLYSLNQLVASGADGLCYPPEYQPQPIAHTHVNGHLLAIVFHTPSQTLFCASQANQTLVITAMAAPDGQLVPQLEIPYPLKFVGLSCCEDQLLLQAFNLDGQLRLMLFDLPNLHLNSSQEKSLAYQGKTVLHPSQPWAMTDLGNGLLLWDTTSESPLGLISCSTLNRETAISWLNQDKFLFIHGTIAEMWSFQPQESPFVSRYDQSTLAILKDFQRWIQLQRQSPGIAVFLGEDGIGKTALLRAYTDLNFADTLCLEIPLDASPAELQAMLYRYLTPRFGQIILDQAERLSAELLIEIIQIAQQQKIRGHAKINSYF